MCIEYQLIYFSANCWLTATVFSMGWMGKSCATVDSSKLKELHWAATKLRLKYTSGVFNGGGAFDDAPPHFVDVDHLLATKLMKSTILAVVFQVCWLPPWISCYTCFKRILSVGFYGPDTLHVIQPSSEKQTRQLKALTPNHGAHWTSSYLDPWNDSQRKYVTPFMPSVDSNMYITTLC